MERRSLVYRHCVTSSGGPPLHWAIYFYFILFYFILFYFLEGVQGRRLHSTTSCSASQLPSLPCFSPAKATSECRRQKVLTTLIMYHHPDPSQLLQRYPGHLSYLSYLSPPIDRFSRVSTLALVHLCNPAYPRCRQGRSSSAHYLTLLVPRKKLGSGAWNCRRNPSQPFRVCVKTIENSPFVNRQRRLVASARTGSNTFEHDWTGRRKRESRTVLMCIPPRRIKQSEDNL
ncbi:hypothetical protein BKA70DRAFT_345022 [Coprinopsis sp. MPI-PUGE-AT-0042]|nr:hypothetical protein BKA70DRAFT_345022 [Coprinopsis sp. MPI-PUGE-AT-0042]